MYSERVSPCEELDAAQHSHYATVLGSERKHILIKYLGTKVEASLM